MNMQNVDQDTAYEYIRNAKMISMNLITIFDLQYIHQHITRNRINAARYVQSLIVFGDNTVPSTTRDK